MAMEWPGRLFKKKKKVLILTRLMIILVKLVTCSTPQHSRDQNQKTKATVIYEMKMRVPVKIICFSCFLFSVTFVQGQGEFIIFTM